MTCQYLVKADEGTSYCKLAEQSVRDAIKQAKREVIEECAKICAEICDGWRTADGAVAAIRKLGEDL